jgi:uncharacterized iron-regulated protein
MNIAQGIFQVGRWYNPDSGTEILHQDIIKRCALSNVVLVGEQHDRSSHHRLQLHIAAGILSHRSDVVLGFEMFPKRSNPVLEEWVSGKLDEAEFLEKVNWDKVWGFAPELYMPLFRLCREFRIRMIGLNCPRALVTKVGKLGWKAVDVSDRDGLTPAKPATFEYRKALFGLGPGIGPMATASGPDDPKLDRFVNAQQVWDRSFACRIAEELDQQHPPLVIGIIGSGHLRYKHGTPFQLDDLGCKETMVLLPDDKGDLVSPGIADAIFRLDPPPEHEIKATEKYIEKVRNREKSKKNTTGLSEKAR